ncbi:MAG: ABC transporter permease subunit [Clostridiaceae bacterium]|nr:ABC transporter permease subunit [Clostridiaceae bacterium]
MANFSVPEALSQKRSTRIWRQIKKDYQYYLLLLPAVAWYLIFAYGPLYGLQIAFKNYTGAHSIIDSPWVGLRHFKLFINSYYFGVTIKNTLSISIYSLLAGMPIPILMALMLNEIKHLKYKKFVQTVTYAPHFISTVVLVGIITIVLSPSTGVVNYAMKAMGFEARYFMVEPQSFRHIYVWSGIWQDTGWGSIIYLAALSGVSPELHEAAVIDGATRLQRIRHINIPVIMPTFIILLILSVGSIMSVGYEKVLLLQNDLNKTTSNIISTYVYERGLLKSEYSFASAVGLFNNVINFILLIIVNSVARKFSDTSLF